MDPSANNHDERRSSPNKPPVTVRASDWLWRPWHAKLWWAAIPIYWLGMAASLKIPLLAEFYTSALAGFLNVLFFPMTALLVLGIGFAREWLAASDWEFVESSWEERFPGRSVGGFLDPMADPLDPRSPLYWHRHDR